MGKTAKCMGKRGIEYLMWGLPYKAREKCSSSNSSSSSVQGASQLHGIHNNSFKISPWYDLCGVFFSWIYMGPNIIVPNLANDYCAVHERDLCLFQLSTCCASSERRRLL